MIIGITGTNGSGKSTVVKHLLKKGYALHHARRLFTEKIKEKGLEINRSNMRIVANEMRKEHGNDVVVSLFLKQAKKNGEKNIIIDSIRTLAETETLKKNGGILIAVDAEQSLRYERVQNRRSETDKITFEQFKEYEELEMNDPDPHGMQKQRVIGMADYVIKNNGTIEEMHTEIDEILEKIK